mmetsp:Transcript_119129/g.344579  ORF Transcript_119129/g.344579 Transcript_119129/m.344579 type:complete len:240 (+) Transcript_119129:1194-1913(+)
MVRLRDVVARQALHQHVLANQFVQPARICILLVIKLDAVFMRNHRLGAQVHRPLTTTAKLAHYGVPLLLQGRVRHEALRDGAAQLLAALPKHVLHELHEFVLAEQAVPVEVEALEELRAIGEQRLGKAQLLGQLRRCLGPSSRAQGLVPSASLTIHQVPEKAPYPAAQSPRPREETVDRSSNILLADGAVALAAGLAAAPLLVAPPGPHRGRQCGARNPRKCASLAPDASRMRAPPLLK